MPTIRTYQSQIGPGVAVEQPRANAAAFGSEVAQAIGSAEQAALRLREQQRQRRSEDARASAGVELARLSATAGELVTKRRMEAGAAGEGHQASVLQDYDAAAGAVQANIADPDTARWAMVQLAEQRARLQVQEGGWEAGRRVDKMVGDVATAADIDTSTQIASPSQAGFMAALTRNKGVIDALGIDGATKEKLWTETRSKLALGFGQGVAEHDPYGAVTLIEGGFFAGLIDSDRLAALKNRADTEIKGREAAARQAEAERRREIRDAERDQRDAQRDYRAQVSDNVRALNDRLRDGGIVTAAEIGAATTAAARAGVPELARTTASLGIKSLTMQGLRGQPPVAVQAYINGLSAKITAAGGKADTGDMIAREAATDYLRTAKTELANDPLSFAAREGVVTVPPLDPANPRSFAARVEAARSVSRRYGVPIAVLTDEEAGATAARLRAGGKDGAAAVTALRAFGRDGAFAVARQIAPKDPLAAHMVSLSMLPGGAGRSNVADIQTGREILKANPKAVDAKRASAARTDALADALRLIPQLSNVLPEAADALYAARRNRAGEGDWSDDAYQAAVGAALGGYRDGNGTYRGGLGKDRQGAVTWLPTGVSQDEFDTAIGGLNDAKLAANKAAAPVDARGRPVPASVIQRGRLLPIGDGRYQVQTESGFVGAASGGLFVLNINSKSPAP